MKLEHRLSAHLREAGQKICGQELSFDVVESRWARRALRIRALITLGLFVGLGALSVGLWRLWA
ncbi:MAG: hypothetical protein ACRBK7_18260 [Acidimicrobiales bacterium]